MKKLLLTACSVLALCAIAVGCQKMHDNQTSPESVCIYSAETPATAAAGSRTVTVFATCAWTVVSNDSWLTVTPDSGEKGISEITYTWAANTTGAARTGTLSLKAGSFTDTYKVVQPGN